MEKPDVNTQDVVYSITRCDVITYATVGLGLLATGAGVAMKYPPTLKNSDSLFIMALFLGHGALMSHATVSRAKDIYRDCAVMRARLKTRKLVPLVALAFGVGLAASF